MADATEFDNLAGENTAPTTGEEDPAADFLAREQNELAGIDDDNFGADSTSGTATIEQSGEALILKQCQCLFYSTVQRVIIRLASTVSIIHSIQI